MSIYEEVELEFGEKYNSLQFLTQLKDLEDYKEKKEVKSIIDLKRLKHNMEQLAQTSPNMVDLSLELNNIIEEYKEKKLGEGKRFNRKEEIEKTLEKMYSEFEKETTIDLRTTYTTKSGLKIKNPYNFTTKRINPKNVKIQILDNEDSDTKITPMGVWLFEGYNNVKGYTNKKIGEEFEKVFNDKNLKSSLVRKIKGRLFNIQREIDKGEERSKYNSERNGGKLLGFEYKEAYEGLSELEKEFSKYIEKNKVKEFIKSIKKEAKESFHREHKDYAKDTKISGLEKENEELRKLLKKEKEEPKAILVKMDTPKQTKKEETTPKGEDTTIKTQTPLKTPTNTKETTKKESVITTTKKKLESTTTQDLISSLKTTLNTKKTKEQEKKEIEKLQKEEQEKKIKQDKEKKETLVKDLKEQLKIKKDREKKELQEKKEKERLEKKERERKNKKEEPSEEDFDPRNRRKR